ncbi:hypothetical protein Aiant_19750 [Actinoplanes ianthinogenes]|uniref:Uncharacterized protein n=1 Tax=Actinoplanes ianthinogenes TaxID=122358 RepID=A0ABM7LPY3_9ACTN|nr:hypothetical protein Aiant_19750 [Actinoplanes ianthinogenes]
MFTERLLRAAERAREFGLRHALEELPDELRFRIRLNQSYDGNEPQPGERRYPADSSPERAAELRRCDLATAVAALWRDGAVPEWIDLRVHSATEDTTLIEAACCGRFTTDEERLYHAQGGYPPFQAVGPTLPVHWDGASRFSLYTNAEVWDDEDLAQLGGAAEHVWSLALPADRADDVPALPNVEIIEHVTPGGSDYTRFPRLRHLRLRLTGGGDVQLGGPLPELRGLTITGLPDHSWPQAEVVAQAPGVEAISLRGRGVLWLDGAWPPGLRRLTLGGTRTTGPARLPDRLGMLVLNLPEAGDDEITALLDGVDRLGNLTLRGTRVTDALLPLLLDRYPRTHLDLVDTRISPAGLDRLRAAGPARGILPRLPQEHLGTEDPSAEVYLRAAREIRRSPRER